MNENAENTVTTHIGDMGNKNKKEMENDGTSSLGVSNESGNEEVQKSTRGSVGPATVESSAGVNIRDRGYHIKPPVNIKCKEPAGGYFISKVTSEIKTVQSQQSSSFGKVMQLPSQPAPRITFDHNKSERVVPVNNGQISMIPQPCNRFILRPSILSFPSTTLPGYIPSPLNNTIKTYRNISESVQTNSLNAEPVRQTASSGEISGSNSSENIQQALLTTGVNCLPLNKEIINVSLPVKEACPRTMAVYQQDKTLSKVNEDKEQDSKISQQYYRDIRPSVSNIVSISLSLNNTQTENTIIATTSNESGEKVKKIIADELKNEQNETEKPAEGDRGIWQHDFLAGQLRTHEHKEPENSFSEAGIGEVQARIISDSVINIEIKNKKTPAKQKRSRKPKLPFSPSGNDLSEIINDFSENPQKIKGAKKRKRVEETLDKQYFGALHRTFAKKAKNLTSDFNNEMLGGTCSGNINENEQQIESHAVQSPFQDSDYKLKQKMFSNKSKTTPATEDLNSHHLLQKIDPNDPERKKSLAVFSKKHCIQEGETVPAYKLSFATSRDSAKRKQGKNPIEIVDPSSQEKTICKQLGASEVEANQILIEPVSQTPEKMFGEDINDKEGESSHDKPFMNDYQLNEGKKSFTANENLKGDDSELKQVNKSNKNKLSSQTNIVPAYLVPSNSPTVLLQRISGIKPTESVQVGQSLQPTDILGNRKIQTDIHVNKIDDLNKEISENPKIKTPSKLKQKTKNPDAISKKRLIAEGDTVPRVIVLPESSGKDNNNKQTQEHEQSKTTSRENHFRPFSSEINMKSVVEKPQEQDGVLHKNLLNNKHKEGTDKQSFVNKTNHNDDTARQPHLTKSSIHDNCLCEEQNNPTNGANAKEMHICQDSKFTQPIPVFYSDKGRLVPGPMPITAETYKYLLTRGSVVNTMLPTSNKVQECAGHPQKETGRIICSNVNTVKTVDTCTVNDPTGILTAISKNHGTVNKSCSFSSKGKTVADLLKERRSEQLKESTAKSNTETKSSASKFLNAESSSRSKETDASICFKSVRDKNKHIESLDNLKYCSSSSFDVEQGHSLERVSCTSVNPVNEHFYSNNLPMQPKFKQTAPADSPLLSLSDSEHQYSRPASPSIFPGRQSFGAMKSISLTENDARKELASSTFIPLKVILPSPKTQGINESETMKPPVRVQKVPGVDAQSPFPANSKPSDLYRLDSHCMTGKPTQANQSFAVRIGDKMYIIRPVVPVEHINTPTSESVQLSYMSTIPTAKPTPHSATPSCFKKRKSPASNSKATKAHQQLTHQKDMKKKLKKILKKNKTPFEELIQSLELEHTKGKKKRIRGTPARMISYSCTPSPVASLHNKINSKVAKREEAVISELHNVPEAENISESPDNSRLKQNLRVGKVSSKKATILQIFKVANKNSKFYMHTAKINFTTGATSTYHRWYQHSDYPCTLHLRNSDMIYQIDVESLRSGFYLVSEMDKNLFTRKFRDTATVAAVLSLYPPDINILPDQSLSIAVGKISESDYSEQPIPSESESDNINRNIDNIVRSILNFDTFKDIEHIEDMRYGSVKDVTMSPKCHSSRFYTPELFECFTDDRKSGIKTSATVKGGNSGNNLKPIHVKDGLEEMQEFEVSVSNKARELKIKQSELYQECSKLRDKIQIGKGLLFTPNLSRGLDSFDELGTEASQDDECSAELESISTDWQSIVHFKLPMKNSEKDTQEPTRDSDTAAETAIDLKQELQFELERNASQDDESSAEVKSDSTGSQSVVDIRLPEKSRGMKTKKPTNVSDIEVEFATDLEQVSQHETDRNLNCSVVKKRGRKVPRVVRPFAADTNSVGFRRRTRSFFP